jgi:pantoate kinase
MGACPGMPLTSSAFAPGHITGFFEIHDDDEAPEKRGSRGAGICLSSGVTTRVTLYTPEEEWPDRLGGKDLAVFMRGYKDEAPVTSHVARALMPKGHAAFISSLFELPIGQGLGVSGAAALSTALAFTDILGLPREKAVLAAHEAELANKTGLGDVGPQSIGGIEVRKRPGIPPAGEIMSIRPQVGKSPKIYLVTVGPELLTKDVLNDPERRKRINEVGRECVDKMLGDPSLDNLMALSKEFASKTGLISDEAKDVMDRINEVAKASISMLGNTVFAVAGAKDWDLSHLLGKFGSVTTCTIDTRGATVI